MSNSLEISEIEITHDKSSGKTKIIKTFVNGTCLNLSEKQEWILNEFIVNNDIDFVERSNLAVHFKISGKGLEILLRNLINAGNNPIYEIVTLAKVDYNKVYCIDYWYQGEQE